jgi:hypothetical protein
VAAAFVLALKLPVAQFNAQVFKIEQEEYSTEKINWYAWTCRPRSAAI